MSASTPLASLSLPAGVCSCVRLVSWSWVFTALKSTQVVPAGPCAGSLLQRARVLRALGQRL